jgi:hypothetical protein
MRTVRKDKMKLNESDFKIDTLVGQTFHGYTLGEEWNGWNCPYFTFEQSNKVLEAHKDAKAYDGNKLNAFYDTEKDAFCFELDAGDHIEEFYSVEIEGKKLYPKGSGSWIWEEVEN